METVLKFVYEQISQNSLCYIDFYSDVVNCVTSHFQVLTIYPHKSTTTVFNIMW